MKSLPRCCFLCAITAQALLSGACALRPERAARLYRDVWGVPEGEQQWDTSQRRSVRGDGTLSEVKDRIERRERIAESVAEGRLGLVEAASQFDELNATVPPSPRTYRGQFAGEAEDERCCRQVIAWVKTRLERKSTAKAEMVAERLEEELRAYLHHEDKARLPNSYPGQEGYNTSEAYRYYQASGCGSGR
jgi:hypothetical protein